MYNMYTCMQICLVCMHAYILTYIHQRLKTGDLRRPPYLLFGSFMVVVLTYSQFPYRTKEQNTISEEGPLVWSGKYTTATEPEGHSVFNVFGQHKIQHKICW